MLKNQLRGKRERKTDYHKRFRLLKSRKQRLVVRLFSNSIVVQLVEYSPEGDKVVIGVNSLQLRDLGWKYSCSNIPAAYLTGYMIALKTKVKEAIADIGPHASIIGTKVFAVIKGAVDAGLKIPFDEKMAPTEERISGAHIAAFKEGSKNEKQFSKYPKTGDIEKDFKKLKEKLK